MCGVFPGGLECAVAELYSLKSGADQAPAAESLCLRAPQRFAAAPSTLCLRYPALAPRFTHVFKGSATLRCCALTRIFAVAGAGEGI